MQLNCDLGESYGNWNMGHDAAVMPLIDQASIACGFHAGDDAGGGGGRGDECRSGCREGGSEEDGELGHHDY